MQHVHILPHNIIKIASIIQSITRENVKELWYRSSEDVTLS